MNKNRVCTVESNRLTAIDSRKSSYARRFAMLVISLIVLASQPLSASDTEGTADKAKEVVKETSVAVEEAGTAAADKAKDFWERIDEARLKNRTPDELVAWLIIGVLVGSVAGMMTTFKATGSGKIGRLFLGLAGACLGGMVMHVGKFNFGWGVVLISYEELLFAFLGAVLLIVLGRFMRSRMKKKVPAK